MEQEEGCRRNNWREDMEAKREGGMGGEHGDEHGRSLLHANYGSLLHAMNTVHGPPGGEVILLAGERGN